MNLKPHPSAYTELLLELDLTAASCVFVDDPQRNIDGAVAVGLRPVKFDVTAPLPSYNRGLTFDLPGSRYRL